MNLSITREEEACFKAALALVVVRNRLLRQQQQQQHERKTSNSSNKSHTNVKRSLTTASVSLNDDSEEEDMNGKNDGKKKEAKRVRTMESLLFPWATAAATTSSSSSLSSPMPTSCDKNQNSNTSTAQVISPSYSNVSSSTTINLQQSQKNHIQKMMTTAIRTAMRLLPEHNRNKATITQCDRNKGVVFITQGGDAVDSSSLWLTLSALTSHLASQLSLSEAVSLTTKKKKEEEKQKQQETKASSDINNTKANTKSQAKSTFGKLKDASASTKDKNISTAVTTNISSSNDRNHRNGSRKSTNEWIVEWIGETLQEIMAPCSTRDSTGKRSLQEDASLLEAVFLVWHGILLGGYPEQQQQRQSGITPSSNNYKNSQHLDTCRKLFLEAFCNVLQVNGIFAPTKNRNMDNRNPSLTQDVATAVVAPIAHATATVKMRTLNDTTQQFVRPQQRPNQAWKRIFSVANRRLYHSGIRSNKTNEVEKGQEREKQLLDLWAVHGLQLVQKITNSNKGRAQSRGLATPAAQMVIQERMEATSFLPPADLVKWYVNTVDHQLDHHEQQKMQMTYMKGTTDTKSTVTAPSRILDPGAKLLSMIALYHAVGNEAEAKL